MLHVLSEVTKLSTRHIRSACINFTFTLAQDKIFPVRLKLHGGYVDPALQTGESQGQGAGRTTEEAVGSTAFRLD